MNKTTFFSIAIASILLISLSILAFSSNEVQAVKPPTEETVDKIPVASGLDIQVVAVNNGHLDPSTPAFIGAKLFYGDELCRIDDIGVFGVMFVFGGDTIVRHQNCIGGNGQLVTLDGGTDVSFKKGDILVLDVSATEVFRDTT